VLDIPCSKYVAGKLPRLYICLSNLHLKDKGEPEEVRSFNELLGTFACTVGNFLVHQNLAVGDRW
jgi:hypothetical protein